MRGVEYTLSLFFDYVSRIPIVNKIITAHKVIYYLFGFVIHHKPHYIFKPKLYEFHNRNISLISVNDTKMADYFI